MRSLRSSIIVLSSLASGTVLAQDVTLRVLIPNSSDIRAVNMPSLHRGVHTGYGARTSDGAEVIFAGRLSDPVGTPLTVIAASGDTVPNRLDRTFRHLRVPTIWNEIVYFSGNGVSTPNPADGLYRGTLDGAPLDVHSDFFNRLGPWIEAPFAGAEGIAFVNPGVTAGSGAGISLYTHDARWIPVATYFQPMPDASFVQYTGNSTVGIGGGTIAYSARCTFIGGNAGYGVYTYSIASGQTRAVANWTTPIPGDGRAMEFVSTVDTDGLQVVFVAAAGSIPFGGTAAVCVANTDGTSLRSLTRFGEPVPGVPGKTFRNFGRVAVDGDIVYFQGSYIEGSSERMALFANVDGANIPVILYNQPIDGAPSITPWFDPRGVDGRDAVVLCEYVTSDNPFLQKYMLVHARIGSACPADFDSDGTLDFFDYDAFVNCFEGLACPPGPLPSPPTLTPTAPSTSSTTTPSWSPSKPGAERDLRSSPSRTTLARKSAPHAPIVHASVFAFWSES
ncbi:MAG: hypothetical protein AABZ53_15105 [Planctomycetota bacterium]